jgi:hypothetical protein
VSLRFVPPRADAEIRPASREDIQRRYGFDQQGWRPVNRCRYQGAQACPAGLAGQEAEGRIALKHRVGRRTDHLDLEEMIHHPKTGESTRICSLGNFCQARADLS